MANIFSMRRDDPQEQKISISQMGTDVLLDVLVQAGSALAETDSQKQLIVWLAEHDRALAGGIGFCIADMPWNPETFKTDKDFMVRVTDAASQRTGWRALRYHPNAENLMPMLGWFRKCFVRLKEADINPNILPHWLADMEPDDPALNGFPCCKRHGTLLTWRGCRVCSN